mgnify:CR=1 FL=1
MESDSDILLKKINSLTDFSKKFIERRGLWDKKELFILKKDYPLLPYQIKSHELIKINPALSDEIAKEMGHDTSLRIFLSVDFQFFLSLFDNFKDFEDYFEKDLYKITGFNPQDLEFLFNQMKKTCFEEYDDEEPH